jgi:hypothetical protein
MYDPLAGRFLSADPVSQAPFWSQGLNRYSYVFNDPANNTDPSGFVSANDVGATLTAGFVIGGHLLAGAILAGQTGGIGGLAAFGVNMTSGAHTAHGLLNAPGPAPTTTSPTPIGSMVQEGRPPGTSLFDPGVGAEACGGPLKEACRQLGMKLANSPAGRWAQRHAAQWAPRVADVASRLGRRFADVVSQAARAESAARGMHRIDPNKLNHIFGKAEHGLDAFVRASGGREAAYMKIQEAANAALRSGKLAPGPNGVLPGGNAGPIIDVGGTQIRLIGGRAMDGVVEIGSASRMGLPWVLPWAHWSESSSKSPPKKTGRIFE